MKFDDIKYVYLLGIGGIGMSALARFFKAAGKEVAGYDKTATKLTDELIAEGIDVHFTDDINLIPSSFKSEISDLKSQILIIYTPAVPKDHSEYAFFNLKGFNIKKRAEVLGIIATRMHTIAVAGTHGKTTTSSMVAHILKTAGLDPSAFLGGITQNYNTNLLLGQNLSSNSELQTSNHLVVEADEYDRSFLTLFPNVAIITSIDPDHLDIYGDKHAMEKTYEQFASQVKDALIIEKYFRNKVGSTVKTYTYAYNEEADYYATDVDVKGGYYHYKVVCPDTTIQVKLGIPGLHNIENSVAAIAAAKQIGVSNEAIIQALESFKGVKRRFDYKLRSKKVIFIDDYAHHPEELRAIINSVKDFYPGKRITGVFQPHLYSRTRDFADDFAESLDLLDEAILMEIYPAREQPIDGVTSAMLLKKMTIENKTICQKKDLVKEVSRRRPEILLTLGAGDIDTFLDPITFALKKEFGIE